MPEKPKGFSLLLKVLDDLSDFLPYLVLVGGWAPYLYAHYLWKGIRHDPLTTVDIDFGFKDAPERKSETIADRVRKKNYGEHHVSMDRPLPFVPVVRAGKTGAQADVEFITPRETSQAVKNRLIGKEIAINEIEDFDILLRSTLKMDVEGRSVNLPQPSVFTFHKLLTFARRERSDKQQKDLYYAYYMLFFSPDAEKLPQKISELIARTEEGSRVRENIEKYFKDDFGKGTTFILANTAGSVITTLVPDVRRDAFERIRSLIRDLQ